MAAQHVPSGRVMGFLSVLEHPEFGLFGGYLLLNWAGRPLEFHCTAPIKPNRAQEILYGPTLEPFLHGEQIGATLVGRAKAQALAIFTDREAALALREGCSIPVALVLPPEESPPANGDQRLLQFDGPHAHGPGLTTLRLGRNRLAVPAGFAEDGRRITESLADLPESFDLAEPFARIREAIEEAQKAVRSAA
jgi:hypothetical protein